MFNDFNKVSGSKLSVVGKVNRVSESKLKVVGKDMFEKIFHTEKVEQERAEKIRKYLKEIEEKFIVWTQEKGQNISRKNDCGYTFSLTNGKTSVHADVLVGYDDMILRILKNDEVISVVDLNDTVRNIEEELIKECIHLLFQF